MRFEQVTNKHVIFDWGDTIMRDDRTRTDAMFLWPHVELVVGAEQVLAHLARSTHLSLATNAKDSDESMIRRALARVGVEGYFRSVFSSREIGRKKDDPEFWLHVLRALDAKPDEVVVVGDNFNSDVRVPVSVGLHAIWLNATTTETRIGERFRTIHSLTELIEARGA